MNEPTAAGASCGPARPDRLTVDFFEEPDMLLIDARPGGRAWVFLLLWLVGWTVGCVLLFALVLNQPALGTFLFALPFWASWLCVASLLTWKLFGKDTLFLDGAEAVFRRTALIRLSSRIVPRADVQGFRECLSNSTENHQHQRGIEMVTLGQSVCFAFGLPDQERTWLIHKLNRLLATNGPDPPRLILQPPPPAANGPSRERPIPSSTPDATETLTWERTLSTPPADCRWRLADDADVFTFQQSGQWKFGAVAVLLFMNVFWNGLVSTFVLLLLGLMPVNNPPQGATWWYLFVFLIPFEAVGLAMFAALVLAVLEPVRRTEWRFEEDRIVTQTRWPTYRRTRAWNVLGLDRMELRRGRGNDPRSGGCSGTSAATAGQMPLGLMLVAANNTDLCEITGLTEGEVRWMAGIVLDRRRDWFGK